MRIYKNYFLGLGIVLLGFTGCKKGDGATETPGEIIPPVVEAGAKVLVPVQIGTGKSKMVISYTDGLAFSKIEYGDGKSIVIKYNEAGKPLGLQRFKDDKLVSATDYVLNDKGRVVRGEMAIMKTNHYVLMGHYDLKYNDMDQMTGIDYVDLNDRQVDKQDKRYDAGGNLIGEKGVTTDFIYSYDLKNGLFKHVNYTWLLTIEKDNILFLSGVNNVKDCTDVLSSGNDQGFSYVYNVDGYPEVINTTTNGTKNSVKVVYKEIRTKDQM
jgi:hypothetical protein